MTIPSQPLDAELPLRAYSSQVADLLERAARWRWTRAGLANLDRLLIDTTAALARRDADAMFHAAITLGALAEECERFGGRTDKNTPSEPAEEFPHLRVNELVHRLRTQASPSPATPPTPHQTTRPPHR